MTPLVRRPRHPRRRPLAVLLGILGVLLVPALAAAHPLGNFTINHYTGIRVEPDRILLDVVIDQAEIPTFQARLDFDTDGDGEVSDEETDAGRVTACDGLEPSLALKVGGVASNLTLTEAGPDIPGGGRWPVDDAHRVRLPRRHGPASPRARRIDYADTSFSERLGWREIVVSGSAMTLAGGDGALRTKDTSARLTAYPTNLLTQALADTLGLDRRHAGRCDAPAIRHRRRVAAARAGQVASRHATPAAPGRGSAARSRSAAPTAVPATAAGVPGGVTSGDLPSIFRTADLSPLVLLVSILTAAALGAGHALTPGHGKTLMAAYLVGTRGTPLHAAGLGLSVTFSHTLGILVLAALVVGAGGFLPPDLIVKSAPMVAAISIVAIGGWMLIE